MSKFEKMIKKYAKLEKKEINYNLPPPTIEMTIILYYQDRNMVLREHVCNMYETDMDIIRGLFAIAEEMIEWPNFEEWFRRAFPEPIIIEKATEIWYDQLETHDALRRLFDDHFDWFFEAYQQEANTTL